MRLCWEQIGARKNLMGEGYAAEYLQEKQMSKRFRHLITFLALMVICLACERPTAPPLSDPSQTLVIGGAAPSLAAPSPTLALATATAVVPTATAAPAAVMLSPSLTPTRAPSAPAGRLLSVLTDLELGLPAGNLYEPSGGALSADGQRLYLLGKSSIQQPQYALAQIDTESGRVLRVTPLPGYAAGPIAVGDGSIYLIYASPGEPSHLLKLATTDLRAMADIEVSGSVGASELALDEQGGRLLLSTSAGLEVRAAGDLALLKVFEELRAPAPRLAFDRAARHLYVALDQQLRAYDASLTLLWQQALAAPIQDLSLTPDGRMLYLRTESWSSAEGAVDALWALDAATGQQRSGPLKVLEGQWRLAAADSERAYLLGYATGGAFVAIADAEGKLAARYAAGGSFLTSALHDPGSRRLYLPDSRNHLLQVLDDATLAGRGQIPVGVEIRDIAVGASQLYANDSSGRLRVFDRESLRLLGATQAANGSRIVLDDVAQRLYISRDGRLEIAVVDTQAMTVTAVITGGDRLAVDALHGRLFVGYAPVVYDAQPVGEVRILDRRTLKPLGAIPRPGVPAYNPLRDEIYVTDVSAYVYDGASYQPLGELIPELGAQTLRGCNGCRGVRDLYIYPELDLLAAEMTVYSVGAGAGMAPQPRFFSLKSRAPLVSPAILSLTCGGKIALQMPVDGLLYSTSSYTRYVYYQNLVAQRAGSGEMARWRDGLNAALVIPASRVIYVNRAGEMLLALDMDSWQPLGHIPYYCVHTLDLAIHRLYAVEDSRLTVLRDSGGQPLPSVTAERANKLPGIDGIYASPDYDRDHTLWVTGGGQLFRSTDGGANWVSLAGGLPRLRSQPLSFHLAVSPNYAQDRTLYAGVESGNSVGYGVWRSTDGGDSWEALWQGLEQLRVIQLALSPGFGRAMARCWPIRATSACCRRWRAANHCFARPIAARTGIW